MLDPETIIQQLRPEARARLVEIPRLCVELQAEAARLIADESFRLSSTAEEEEQARAAIGDFFGRVALAAVEDEVRFHAAPAS